MRSNTAGFSIRAGRLLFFGKKKTQKSQNYLMMSVFCSNTLIFAPEFWKCNLRGPDCKMFLEDMPLYPPSNLCFWPLQVAPVARVFPFSAYSKAFNCHLLKTLWKTLHCLNSESGKHYHKVSLTIWVSVSVLLQLLW